MADLTDEQKRFIVQRLACYRWPSEVVKDVAEEFGIEIDRMKVRQYNPTQCQVAKKWQDLFAATREKYLADTSSIGVAQLAFRLAELDRQLRDVYRSPKVNRKEAREILEQAARDAGGAYTNHRVVDGKFAVSIDDFLAEPEES